ncbi:MAG: hypothetical protein FWF85_07435 [Clostridiales bacterium]|jgi:Ca2+/Na+ antiporter|nr:hypothetical protein [Clostridiales bacterium]MDR2713600.1 hypothetical protein [Clostridiales bacterium]
MLELIPLPFNLTLLMVAISYYCYNNWKLKSKFKEYLPVLVTGVGAVVGIGGGWITFLCLPDWGLWEFWLYFSLIGLILFLIFSTRLVRVKKKDFNAAHAREQGSETGKTGETGAKTMADPFIVLVIAVYGFIVFCQILARVVPA